MLCCIAAGAYHEQLHIESNSTGHSYEKVFGPFLDETLTVVEVEDPYIRNGHQVSNMVPSMVRSRHLYLLTLNKL